MSEGEVLLAARAVEAGVLARDLLERTGSDLGRSVQRELQSLVEEGERRFRILTLSNLRLVFHWSKGIARAFDENWAQDAFQAGCIGLMRGLQSWDYSKGYQLSTYVSWHIRQSIQRWRANEVYIIRLPVHIWDSIHSQNDQMDEKTRAMVNDALSVRSSSELEAKRDGLIWDGGIEEAGAVIERRILIARLLDGLSEKEAGVVRMRFGLGVNDGPQTLDQIGLVFGLTRERIRQIEGKALTKLRARGSRPLVSTTKPSLPRAEKLIRKSHNSKPAVSIAEVIARPAPHIEPVEIRPRFEKEYWETLGK